MTTLNQTTSYDPSSVFPSKTETLRPSVGVGIANGTFGELLQGSLPGEQRHFLVTLPIASYSRAFFFPSTEDPTLHISPTNKTKSLRLAHLIMRHLGIRQGGEIVIESDLPEGKGLASSSADLVAVARSLGNALNRRLSRQDLLHFLRSIEPSDGIMYPDYVSFFHRKVELGRRLGFLPAMQIVAIDEGGEVDTLAFNHRSTEFTAKESAEYQSLLERLMQAFQSGDVAELGRISTRSAILNQRHNPKRHLEQVLAISQEAEALGVVVAHSGTCIGILLHPGDPQFEQKRAIAVSKLGAMGFHMMHLKTIDCDYLPASYGDPTDATLMDLERADNQVGIK